MRNPSVWSTTAVCLAIVGAVIGTFASPAEAVRYQFVKLAETGATFEALGDASINNRGMVAFNARLTDGNHAVFTTDGGVHRQAYLADEGGAITSGISINDHGDMVFGARRVVGQTTQNDLIMLIDGQIRVSGDPRWAGALLAGSINNHRDVAAWVANNRRVQGGLYILNDDGRQRISDAMPAPSIAQRSSLYAPPVINESGQIAIAGRVEGDHDIYIWDGDSIQPVLQFLGRRQIVGDVSFNDGGDLAFVLQTFELPLSLSNFLVLIRDAETHLLAGSGLPLEIGGPFDRGLPRLGPVSPATLNNAGQVAFVARPPGADMGIFLGPDPVLDRVITANDLLDGASVWSLTLGRESLNDRGQVVFQASLSDGRTALFRADPIPEPATSALALVALVTLSCPRRRPGRG